MWIPKKGVDIQKLLVSRLDPLGVALQFLWFNSFFLTFFLPVRSQEGLADERGNLFWEIIRLIRYHRPRSILLENVPGLLLNQDGATFQLINQELNEAGYDVLFNYPAPLCSWVIFSRVWATWSSRFVLIQETPPFTPLHIFSFLHLFLVPFPPKGSDCLWLGIIRVMKLLMLLVGFLKIDKDYLLLDSYHLKNIKDFHSQKVHLPPSIPLVMPKKCYSTCYSTHHWKNIFINGELHFWNNIYLTGLYQDSPPRPLPRIVILLLLPLVPLVGTSSNLGS